MPDGKAEEEKYPIPGIVACWTGLVLQYHEHTIVDWIFQDRNPVTILTNKFGPINYMIEGEQVSHPMELFVAETHLLDWRAGLFMQGHRGRHHLLWKGNPTRNIK